MRPLLQQGLTPQQAALRVIDECLATDNLTPASSDNITGEFRTFGGLMQILGGRLLQLV